MAVIGISYSGCDHTYNDDGERIELNPSTLEYHHVYLHTKDDEYVFESGNFVKDWYDAKKKYIEIQSDDPYLSGSSTCDHFQMDGAKFDSGYLHFENDEPVLKYVDMSDPNYLFTQREIYQDGWEFFVPEGTQPTWVELKEMCK